MQFFSIVNESKVSLKWQKTSRPRWKRKRKQTLYSFMKSKKFQNRSCLVIAANFINVDFKKNFKI